MIMIMSDALSTLFESGRDHSLEAGKTLFRSGDPVRFMYLVTAGRIDLVRHKKNGTPLILNRAGPGDILAEASAYSDIYHCNGEARSRSRMVSLPLAEFHEKLHDAPTLAGRWAAQLSRELQKARMQAEIRSLKTVAERLEAWLGDDATLPPKGQIQDLAYVLGVSREALYRELARRRS